MLYFIERVADDSMSSSSLRGGRGDGGPTYRATGEGSSTSTRGGSHLPPTPTRWPRLASTLQVQDTGSSFDPAPASHNEYVECRVWRVIVGLNGVTLLYAFGVNGDAFGVDNTPFRIHNFVSHLQSYGFDTFTPVARVGQSVPPERFGELVRRWWGVDGQMCLEGTSRWGDQPLTFWELWGRMYEAGFGIPTTPF